MNGGDPLRTTGVKPEVDDLERRSSPAFGRGMGQKARFVKVYQQQFWDLFVCPVYSGLKLQILAWIVCRTWGQRDWERGENRRFTERPISPAVIARDIGRPRESVSRALADLRADGVLVEGKNGGEGIDKNRLRELAKRDASVTPQTVTSTSHRDAHVTPSVMPTSHHRDAHVTVNSHKAKPDRQLSTLQTRQTIQTKRKRGAARTRASTLPRFQEFISWWLHAWSEHNNNQEYFWSTIDDNHLMRLLSALGFDELTKRCRFALTHAGKPGTALHWLKPPVTFSHTATNINSCVAPGAADDRYPTPEELETWGVNHEATTGS